MKKMQKHKALAHKLQKKKKKKGKKTNFRQQKIQSASKADKNNTLHQMRLG